MVLCLCVLNGSCLSFFLLWYDWSYEILTKKMGERLFSQIFAEMEKGEKSVMSKIVFFCIPAHGHTNPTLGAGMKLCNQSSKGIRQAVMQVLSDASYREHAALIAEGFRRCEGAKGAAEKILKVCGNAYKSRWYFIFGCILALFPLEAYIFALAAVYIL